MAGEPGYEYDVALSFAGEQRAYVERVADHLRRRGVRPFYDAYEKVNLWGKDLYEHLDYVYRRAARYCVVFASEEYAQKAWTSHERRSAQARAINEKIEYILPARFDDTHIPGIRPTAGYVDLADTEPEDLAELIIEKLGPRVRHEFFPPDPDLLLEALEVRDAKEAEYAVTVARSVFRSLRRTTPDERRLIFHVFAEGCESELPDNVHISLDLIRRMLNIPPAEAFEMLRGLGALGFDVQRRAAGDDHDDDDMVEFRWHDLFRYNDEREDAFAAEQSTAIARAVVLVASGDSCMDCALSSVVALDFSELSSASAAGGHRDED